MNTEIEHGTLRRYRVASCRCEKCRAANAKYQREYQAQVRRRKLIEAQREEAFS